MFVSMAPFPECALEHGCECIGPQLDKDGNVAFYLFNECAGDRSTFSARTEEELIQKLKDRAKIVKI